MATTTEASSEEDDPKDSTTTAETYAEEVEETTRLSERLRRRRRRCIYRPRELTTKTAASARGLSDDDGGVGGVRGIDDASEGLEMTTEAAGVRQRERGTYNNDGGLDGGR